MDSPVDHPSLSADIVTTGRDGKEHRYHRIGRTGSKRSSRVDGSNSAGQSSDATPAPLSPSIREVRPLASRSDRPSRRSTKYSYPSDREASEVVALDGSTIPYPVPSIDVPLSSTSAALHEMPPVRRFIQRKSRPSAIIVENGASMTSTSSSLNAASPGLSNLPSVNLGQDSVNDLPPREPNRRYHARVDSLADDDEFEPQLPEDENERQANIERARLDASERYQQERISRELELDQARLERERIAESERRQSARLSRQAEARQEEQPRIERHRLAESDRRQKDRLSRQAKARDEEQIQRGRDHRAESGRQQQIRSSREAEAHARATALADEAQRERHRQDTIAALERRSQENVAHRRGVDAEIAQMARERSIADARLLAPTTPQYYEPRSLPVTPQGITYATLPRTPISARQITNTHASTPPMSARYPVTVHNQYTSPTPRDSLRERGAAVIAREQAAAAQFPMQRSSAPMAARDLRDEELDDIIEARMYQSSSRRQPRDMRELEEIRQRRYERQQRYY